MVPAAALPPVKSNIAAATLGLLARRASVTARAERRRRAIEQGLPVPEAVTTEDTDQARAVSEPLTICPPAIV
jgi:hypothetical protein